MTIFSRLFHEAMVILLLLLIAVTGFAGDKVQLSAEPAWLINHNIDLAKKPATRLISNGYYLALVDHQVNLVNRTEYMHIIREVVNETGVQNVSDVSVSFSPSFQQVIFHKVNLVRNNSIVSSLNPRDIKIVQEESDADNFQYSGIKRAYTILKDVRKGDRIDFAYSVIGFNPVFKDKYADKIYFALETAVSNYFETIIAPKTRRLFFQSVNKAPLATETMQGDLKLYSWSNPDVKVWQSQPGVPTWFNNYPCVSVTEFEHWRGVVDWGMEIFKNYDYPFSPALDNEIAGWRKTAGDDKDVFSSLALRFVQDKIRYLGLEIGVNTHQPHDPSEVFQQRFGDCKDKALLLATILQKEGIPAYVALVNTSERDKTKEAVPSITVFNHAIVAVERNRDYFFIDPTATGQRGEFVNTYIDGYGYALVLKKGQDTLSHVEPGYLNESTIVERFDISYTDTSRFSVSTIYSGGRADDLRNSIAGMSSTEMDDNYKKYYSKTYEDIEQAAPIDIEDDGLKNDLTVKEFYAIPSLWETDEKGKKSFEVFAKAIYEEIPDPSAVFKDAPVALHFPLSVHYTIELNMPSSWELNLPGIHIKNESYQFDFVSKLEANKIKLKYYFKTFRDHIPVSEIARFKSDYKKIVATLDLNMTKTGFETATSFDPDKEIDVPVNLRMVVLAFLTIVGLGFLLRFLNSRNVPVYYEDENRQLSGWLIFLAVVLGLGILVNIFNFTKSNFFDKESWALLETQGGSRLQNILRLEMVLSLLAICGNVAAFYWLLRRRDIFPSMFIWFLGTNVAGQLILNILYSFSPAIAHTEIMNSAVIRLGRTAIFAVIWILYILRSEQVKATFTKTS
ncbi:MAG: DUF3857 domain-containing protein [Chitinophagaceae bacterium]